MVNMNRTLDQILVQVLLDMFTINKNKQNYNYVHSHNKYYNGSTIYINYICLCQIIFVYMKPLNPNIPYFFQILKTSKD